MFEKAFDTLTLADLEGLVEARIPEGRRLEYKRDHYGSNDNAKREFAADVSALANAQGGYLLVGVAEENGAAARIHGVEVPDPDAFVRQIADKIRTATEPPILSFRVRWIETAAPNGVLVIQVDRSWSAPHRVTVAGGKDFYIRNENGKHPMSVTELRRAFLFATEIEERIRRFRADRLALLAANEGPLAIKDEGPTLVMHLVPQATFTEGVQIPLDSDQPGLPPLGTSGFNSMYSLDGLVTYSGPEERFETVRAFSTLFRTGIVEAVAQMRAGTQAGQRAISLEGAERDLITGLKQALTALEHRKIAPPYYLMLSLVGVRGFTTPQHEWGGRMLYPHRADRIILPELLLDSTMIGDNPATLLRPVFDLLWNAFGQPGSPSYDGDGRYGRR